MTIVQKLFSFQGRLSRLDWWAYGVALNIVGAALTGLFSALFIKPEATLWGSATAPAQMVGLAVSAVLVWPSLALTVKRRHDRDRPGWMMGLLFIVMVTLNSFPILYVILPLAVWEHWGWWPTVAFCFFMLALWIAILVLLGIRPGTPGPNRYGPSPLAEHQVP